VPAFVLGFMANTRVSQVHCQQRRGLCVRFASEAEAKTTLREAIGAARMDECNVTATQEAVYAAIEDLVKYGNTNGEFEGKWNTIFVDADAFRFIVRGRGWNETTPPEDVVMRRLERLGKDIFPGRYNRVINYGTSKNITFIDENVLEYNYDKAGNNITMFLKKVQKLSPEQPRLWGPYEDKGVPKGSFEILYNDGDLLVEKYQGRFGKRDYYEVLEKD